MKTINIEIFGKKDCHLCEEAEEVLHRIQADYDFHINHIDITQNEELFKKYGEEIPVIFLNGEKIFKYKIDEQQLINILNNAYKNDGSD